MRNAAGGFLGALLGSCLIVWLLTLPRIVYPDPFDMVWFLLVGSAALQTTAAGLLNISTTLIYFIVWLIIGLVISPFSKSNWNSVRTAEWTGVFLALFTTLSAVLLDPLFWTSGARNARIIEFFATCLLFAPLALAAAVPVRVSVNLLRRKEVSSPGNIETVCECGAVFKSKPMLCSECGRLLAGSDSQETSSPN